MKSDRPAEHSRETTGGRRYAVETAIAIAKSRSGSWKRHSRNEGEEASAAERRQRLLEKAKPE
ncbi:MAG TPA: hypothetical protein VFA94_15575 [Acidimicrobiales bacterium]|nr:hypothetical protein [Acidimicrobiales bacterium]